LSFSRLDRKIVDSLPAKLPHLKTLILWLYLIPFNYTDLISDLFNLWSSSITTLRIYFEFEIPNDYFTWLKSFFIRSERYRLTSVVQTMVESVNALSNLRVLTLENCNDLDENV